MMNSPRHNNYGILKIRSFWKTASDLTKQAEFWKNLRTLKTCENLFIYILFNLETFHDSEYEGEEFETEGT